MGQYVDRCKLLNFNSAMAFSDLTHFECQIGMFPQAVVVGVRYACVHVHGQRGWSTPFLTFVLFNVVLNTLIYHPILGMNWLKHCIYMYMHVLCTCNLC